MEYTEAKKNADPIRDDEFKKFIEQDFSNRLELELSEMPIGKNIRMLEKLGLDISIKSVIDKYIEQEGYTLDNVGNLVIREDAINKIYFFETDIISQMLGVDILKITDEKQLYKIINNPEYRKNVAKYGLEDSIDIKTFDRKKSLLYEELSGKSDYHINYSTFSSNFAIEKALSDVYKGDIEKAKEVIKRHERNTLNTNISKKSDAELFGLLNEIRVFKENNIEESDPKYKKLLTKIDLLCRDSDFKKHLVDANGKFDVNAALAFLPIFENYRNKTKVFEKLNEFHDKDVNAMDKENLKELAMYILRAERTDDDENKDMAVHVSEHLKIIGYDLLTEDGTKLDSKKVEEFCKILYGPDVDLDKLKESEEWNQQNTPRKLEKIIDAIDKGLGVNCKTREELNVAKEEYNRIEQETYSKRMMLTMSMINGKKLTPEQIVGIFVEFRTAEMNEKKLMDNEEMKNMNPAWLSSCKSNGISSVLKSYIEQNPEDFSEYIENGAISGKKMLDFVKSNPYSMSEKITMLGVIDELSAQTRTIDINREKYSKDYKDLTKKISVLGNSKERGTSIDENELNELFRQAKRLQKYNVLSPETIEQLKDLDEKRFEKAFKMPQVKMNFGKNSLNTFWYGKLATSVREGLFVLPKAIFQRSKVRDYTFGEQGKWILNNAGNKSKIRKIIENRMNGRKKDENEKTNLPVEKKESIFDKIRAAFKKTDKQEDIESKKMQTENQSDKETQNPTFASESLTGSEKSDTTVIQTDDMDYLKVGFTPRYKQDASKSEQGNQNGTGELNPEEQEIRE